MLDRSKAMTQMKWEMTPLLKNIQNCENPQSAPEHQLIKQNYDPAKEAELSECGYMICWTMLQLEKAMEIMNELDKYNTDVASLQEIRTRTNR